LIANIIILIETLSKPCGSKFKGREISVNGTASLSVSSAARILHFSCSFVRRGLRIALKAFSSMLFNIT